MKDFLTGNPLLCQITAFLKTISGVSLIVEVGGYIIKIK